MSRRLGEISYVTKLAGFEHTKYIQGNCTHEKMDFTDVPLFIGKTVRDGRIDKEFDWYIPETISNQLERSKLTKKCIVLPYVGSVGDLAIFDGSYAAHLGSNISKIELEDDCGYTEEFVYYFLKSPYGQKLLLRDIQGAVQKNITMEAIRKVELPDISINTQNKIVDILSNIDKKIDINNQINAELEDVARTIYEHWFLQYEFPNSNGEPYATNDGEFVVNDSIHREIPKGWNVKILDECVETIIDRRGVTPKKLGGDWAEDGILALSAKVVKGNKLINLNDANRVSQEMYDRWMPDKLKSGDILMTSEAPLGEFYYLIENEEYCLSQRLFALRADKSVCNSSYLFYELYKGNGYSQIMGSQSGSTVFGIRQDELRKIKLVIPPLEIQKQFEDIMLPMFLKIRRNDEENREFISLRDFLLPLLINGQIRFKGSGNAD